MSDKLVDRLQNLSDALEEAIDRIESLEAILEHLQTRDPDAVDNARAAVAAARKN